MTSKTEVQLTFTKEQLADFLDIVCHGEWMINAPRVDRIKKYDELAQHVFKAARAAGVKGVEYDEDDKSCWLTGEYEESILQEFKEEYDNEVFWDALSDRLAARDLESAFGSKAIEAMDGEERFKKHMTICQIYEDEFEKHGIDRLTIPGFPPPAAEPDRPSA
ncbi:MAG: hypothetical protein WC943_12500 [Elusimicrobiota bacterium]|jgi:hypothetical protein